MRYISMKISNVTDMLDLAVQTSPDYDTTKSLRKRISDLTSENAQLRESLMHMERAADSDPLLPLYNRRAFVREIDRARTVMSRYDILSSIIYFDLNNFKRVNDQYGHAMGDDVLRGVAEVLLSGVRDCDIVARLGGDEFGVILFNTTQGIAKAKAAVLACRIAEQKISIPTGDISTSTAWGIASCEPGDNADQILSRADRAMYRAKAQSDAA